MTRLRYGHGQRSAPLQRSAALLALVLAPAAAAQELRIRGAVEAWRPAVLDLIGLESAESADPNPFLDYRLEARFESGAASLTVPGFFAADGDAGESGAESGKVWRIIWVPEQTGTWRYRISFRRGTGIAIAGGPAAAASAPGDGIAGAIEVAPAPAGEPGMLRYAGARYLRFAANGAYFLKGGADSPENFLAYTDFDGAGGEGAIGERREGEARKALRHRYEPHEKDWRPGDPSWRGGRGKGIVGALNYLASQGVNSVYFLTMNIAGDGDDVWPYRGKDERFRFDVSKLAQWETVFSWMDRLGIQLHVVLSETENESFFEAEEGGVEFAARRKLYYRELIARFAHHRAVVWNLGEENGWSEKRKEGVEAFGRGNTDAQRRAFASWIRALDPYDHPIVVHTLPGRYDEIYTPLLGHAAIEGPSLQVELGERIHAETLKWIRRSAAAGRPWVATLDEIGPASTGVKPDADDPGHDAVRRLALWGHLMAGGAGCEWYFGYEFAHNDLDLEDFRSREAMWRQTRIAIEFFQRHLPFWEMASADDLVRGAEGAHCFAKPGAVYAVYLPAAGSAELSLPEGRFRIEWLDPRAGGELQAGSAPEIEGVGFRALGKPPRDEARDWAALVRAR